jgi:YVTN family beta-propeller protein
VSVINGATNTVVATVTVGNEPDAIAVNSATNQIYVTNHGSGTMSVISGATNTVAATVTVDSEPDAVAVNPATSQIYSLTTATARCR